MAGAHLRRGGFSSPRRRVLLGALRLPPATGLRSSRSRWPRRSPDQILDRLPVRIHQLGVPLFEGPALVARRVHPARCPHPAGKAAVDARRRADVAQDGADSFVERRVVVVVDLQPPEPLLDLPCSPGRPDTGALEGQLEVSVVPLHSSDLHGPYRRSSAVVLRRGRREFPRKRKTRLAGALVVMDRGVATDACVTWLRDNGYRYLVVSRERHRRFDADAAVSLQTQSDQTVHMHKVVSTDPDEVRLYCYSEERANKERGIVERFAARFETALTKLNDGLSRPRAHKRLDQVWQRIGRLKAKHSRVASHYQITVTANEAGDQAVAVNWTRRPQDGSMVTHPGVYCLRSSETDWNEDALWRTYTTLTDVEAVFRSLKSELGLRPIYHRKPARADGHLFITVIAYQLVQVIRTRLRARREHARWTTLRRVLEGQQRVTATFRRPDGRTLHVRTATQAEPDQRAIYDALGVDPHPGGVRKTLV